MRNKRPRLILCCLSAVVISVSSCAANADPPAISPELIDYLVQDVCVDSSNHPTTGDPAVCKSHRNLQVGEPLPYLLTDFDSARRSSHQAVSSLPVRGSDGQLKVLVLKMLQGSFSRDSRLEFADRRDGFDLIDISHSDYASIVRTSDPGCYDQIFSRNGRVGSLTDRSGGWVLFPLEPAPTQWPRASSLHLTTWRVQLSAAAARCASNHATGLTTWYRPASYTFESGKQLIALRTEHFAAENLTQSENAFERFYFTREYGLTRWESWQTLASCQKSFGNSGGRCAGEPHSPAARMCGAGGNLEEYGGQTWVRVDCRDFSHYLPLARSQFPLSRTLGSANGVRDIDYQATIEGK
jgi:hypothetical protein